MWHHLYDTIMSDSPYSRRISSISSIHGWISAVEYLISLCSKGHCYYFQTQMIHRHTNYEIQDQAAQSLDTIWLNEE